MQFHFLTRTSSHLRNFLIYRRYSSERFRYNTFLVLQQCDTTIFISKGFGKCHNGLKNVEIEILISQNCTGFSNFTRIRTSRYILRVPPSDQSSQFLGFLTQSKKAFRNIVPMHMREVVLIRCWSWKTPKVFRQFQSTISPLCLQQPSLSVCCLWLQRHTLCEESLWCIA